MDQRWDRLAVDVIALPVRIGRRGASLGVAAAWQVADLGLRAVESLISRAVDIDEQEMSDSDRVAPVASPPPAPPPAPAVDFAPPPPPPPPPPAPEPAHVSEEPELVDSYAEPGAEDGPGASVHVAEPWKGYGQMAADDVVDRLAAASREEIAAVELYERLHRSRRTVLTAAERQLRRASVPRSSARGG